MSVKQNSKNTKTSGKVNQQKQNIIFDNKNKNTKSSKLKEKVFQERKSLIHELYEEKHIKNIHYMFMVLLLTLFINQIADGIIHEGRWSFHINIIWSNFSDGYIAIIGWFAVFAIILLVYPVFQLWAITHIQMLGTPLLRQSWDSLWIVVVLGFYYKVFQWTGEYVTNYELSFTSSFALLIEATRFLMKAHAFIRGNVMKVVQENENFKMPTLFHYIEFLFVPTLVYRESYPRKKSVNWLNVIIYAMELCAVVIFLCYLYNMYFSNECTYFKTTQSYYIKEYLWLIFRNTIPCMGCMFLMFYFVLHSWQNLFGELTRFADCEFYQDWWTSTSYDEYYRKWNIVVHDWLYNYIYKDIFETFTLKTPLVPKIVVFLISAVVHEYVLYYTMRMFFPVLSIMFFTFGMLFTTFRTPKYWIFNVLFLYGYGLGFSILITSYTTEYCVRQNPCANNSTKIPYDWVYSQILFSDCVV